MQANRTNVSTPAPRRPHGRAREDQARGGVDFAGVWARRGIKRDDAEWNQRQERRIGDQGFAALLVPSTVCRMVVVGCVHDITTRERDAVDVPADSRAGCDIRDAAACPRGLASQARIAGRVVISGGISEYVRAQVVASDGAGGGGLNSAAAFWRNFQTASAPLGDESLCDAKPAGERRLAAQGHDRTVDRWVTHALTIAPLIFNCNRGAHGSAYSETLAFLI